MLGVQEAFEGLVRGVDGSRRASVRCVGVERVLWLEWVVRRIVRVLCVREVVRASDYATLWWWDELCER